LRNGIQPRRQGQWPHEFVQAEFAGKLINRRRRYPPELRSTLPSLQALRNRADYELEEIKPSDAARALRQGREFVDSVRSGEFEMPYEPLDLSFLMTGKMEAASTK
jgi:hypothetical protein